VDRGLVDPTAQLMEQVDGPVPALGGFDDDLGALAGGGDGTREGEHVVVRHLGDRQRFSFGAAMDDHAPTPVQVDADIGLGWQHGGPPSSWSGWFRHPESPLTRPSTARGNRPFLLRRVGHLLAPRVRRRLDGLHRVRHTGAASRSFITSTWALVPPVSGCMVVPRLEGPPPQVVDPL